MAKMQRGLKNTNNALVGLIYNPLKISLFSHISVSSLHNFSSQIFIISTLGGIGLVLRIISQHPFLAKIKDY